MAKKHLAVRLEDEQIEQFRLKCIEDDITQAEVISLLLNEYLNGSYKLEKPKPRIVKDE